MNLATLASTSNWEIASAIGTIAVAITTLGAVVVALIISQREHGTTKQAVEISRKSLEQANEDRRETRRATVVVELVANSNYFTIKARNAGPAIAHDVIVFGAVLGTGRYDAIRAQVLGVGQSIGQLRPQWLSVRQLERASVTLQWTDGNGRHDEQRNLYKPPLWEDDESFDGGHST